jgi:hypothetical protein
MKPYLPFCHCEHLKGTCLHAEVPAFAKMVHAACVTARRRGNLTGKDEIASLPAGRQGFTRNDNSLNRNLGFLE